MIFSISFHVLLYLKSFISHVTKLICHFFDDVTTDDVTLSDESPISVFSKSLISGYQPA